MGHDFANENEKVYNLASKSFNYKQQHAPLAFCKGYISQIHLTMLKKYFYKANSNVTLDELLATKFGL